jgi:hypothetical protein
MTVPECPREQDVINAIVAGRWPDDGFEEHSDDTLQAHATQCQICRELVEVTSLLRVERDGLHDEMNVPSAGQVWWRAAIRARLEASEQAARPLSWVFGLSVACVVGLAVAGAELLWSPFQQAVRSVAPGRWTLPLDLGEFTRLLPSLTDLPLLTTTGAFVLFGAAACLLLAPLALYFALSDE